MSTLKYFFLLGCLSLTYFLFGQNSTDRIRIMSVDNVDNFYKYDSIGRCTHIIKSNDEYHTFYKYKKDTVEIYLVSFIDTSFIEFIVLNKDRYVDNWCIKSDTNLFCAAYMYNSLGVRTNQSASNSFMKFNYTFEVVNGNTIKEYHYDTIQKDNKFQVGYTVTENTFSDLPNLISNENFGAAMKGKSDKNLLIKSNTESFASDICDSFPCPLLQSSKLITEFKFEYLYDEKGRIKQKIAYKTTTNEKSITNYYYY